MDADFGWGEVGFNGNNKIINPNLDEMSRAVIRVTDFYAAALLYSPPWHHGYDETFATKSAVLAWNPAKTPAGWDGFGARDVGSWGGSRYVYNGLPETKNLDGDDSRVIMDRAIPFIAKAVKEEKLFFATIWFHALHEHVAAGTEYLAKYPGLSEEQKHFYGCTTAMDEQIGRLREYLKKRFLSINLETGLNGRTLN